MDSKQSRRNKSIGRQLENDAIRELWMFDLVRTGSTAYSKAAADLVPSGDVVRWDDEIVVPAVVTRDKGHDMLITLSVKHLVAMLQDMQPTPLFVQCKHRQQTWIGRLYRELRAAIS